MLARGRHGGTYSRHGVTRQQHVPVHPVEHEFPQVVHSRLFEQRQRPDPGEGEFARYRLVVVVEVDQQTFIEARLDKAVGVTIEMSLPAARP